MTPMRSPELQGAIADIRAALDAAAANPGTSWTEHLSFPPAVTPDDVTVTRGTIDGLPYEWIERAGADRSVRILLFHGGGFVEGGLGSHRHFAVTLAEFSGFPVMVLDYRLAPAHPFPAALDDCTKAVEWLWDHDVFGANPAEQIYFVGDSAGGNLALAAAIRGRDNGLRPVDGIALLSPWTDLTMTRPSHEAMEASDFLLGGSLGRLRAAIADGHVNASDQPYLAGHPADDPLVSPLFADLTGLPPMLCLVADDEMLRDDSVEFCERARHADVPIRLEIVSGVFHAWPVYGRLFPEAVAAIDLVAASIRETAAGRRAALRMTIERDLSWHIAENARRHGDRIAVIEGARTLRWAAFGRRIDTVAQWLNGQGIGAGAKIATVGANTIEHLLLFCAALRSGAAIVPLSPMAGAGVLARMIADCDADAIGVTAAYRDLLDDAPLPGVRLAFDFADTGWTGLNDIEGEPSAFEPPPIDPAAPFDIIYSSGTTGTPKGIVHSRHVRFCEYSGSWGLGYTHESIGLVSTPFYSNTTLAGLLPALAYGGTTVLTPRFDAREFLVLAQTHRVTHAMLVPIQYQRILDVPDFDDFDLSAFRMKLCTSAPLPVAMKQAVRDRWPGGFMEFYGMTEGGVVCALDVVARPDKLATVGQPLAGGELKILDDQGRELPPGEVGEIVGRSAVMMEGYHGRPGATAEASWIDSEGRRWQRTGDLGRIDGEGFLTLLDRRKDMIISGGFNIYAIDLENELRRHPAVADVAVIGVPSDRWGETPLAFVVPQPNLQVAGEEIRDWVNARLGKAQRLHDVVLRDALPRNALGKILKRELRAPYWRNEPALETSGQGGK